MKNNVNMVKINIKGIEGIDAIHMPLRGEWPSGPASSISLTDVKHGCVWSETGWATFQMNDQNSSLSRPSEGTLN